MRLSRNVIFTQLLSRYFTAVDVPKNESKNDLPPVIASHLTSATVTDGDAVTLQCQIIGKPIIYLLLQYKL